VCACVRIQFITDCLDYALVSRYSSRDRRIDINYLNFSDIRMKQFIISSFCIVCTKMILSIEKMGPKHLLENSFN